jgi:hypothetical protein
MCISSESHRFVQGKNDTKPIHSLQFQAIATRPPIGTDIHRPVIINVKRFLRMFAERLTSAAIIFFILLLILWLLHCVQIHFMHCAKTQALQVIDLLPVLLIALAFFTLLIFVCRQILLPQLPREN